VGKPDHCVLELVLICRIHCIDQFKTFTLLFKSKNLGFETLSHVHVYRIEYVSYRQGPYRIRIDKADDRIVPALAGTGSRDVSALNVQCTLNSALLLDYYKRVEYFKCYVNIFIQVRLQHKQHIDQTKNQYKRRESYRQRRFVILT